MSNLIEWKTASQIIEILKSQNALVSGMTVTEAAAALGFTKTASGLYVKTLITTGVESVAGTTATSVASSAATTVTTSAANLVLTEGATGTAEVGGLASVSVPIAAVVAAAAGGYLIGTEIYEANPAILDPILLPIYNFITGDDITTEELDGTPTVPIIFNSEGQTFMDSRVIDQVKDSIDSNSTIGVEGSCQQWSGYPDSPEVTIDYPYQGIYIYNGEYYLAIGKSELYVIVGYLYGGSSLRGYKLINNVWTLLSGNYFPYTSFVQANHAVYTSQYKDTILFAKTTSAPLIPPTGITKYTPGVSVAPLTFPDEIPDWEEVVLPRILPNTAPTPSQTPDANPDPEKITPFINPVQPVPTWIPVIPSQPDPTIPIVPVANPEPDTSTAPFPDPDPAVDPSQLAEVDPIPESVPIPDPIDSGGINAPAIPITPAIASSASGLLHVYNPTNTQIESFGAWLWTTFSGDLIDTLAKLFNNPMDAVIGLHELYATPATSSTETTIKAGYLDSGVASRLVTTRYTEIKCGALSVPEYWGNYLDYTPYTKTYCYLPFIGIVELNTDDIVGSGVEITYKIDSFNGSCIALITTAKAGTDESVTYEFSGNCAVEIPITSGMKTAVQGALIGATTLALAASTGGASIAAAAMIGGARGGATKNVVQHSGSFGSSYGAMGIKTPYLIIKRPKQKVVYGYNSNYGYPAHKMVLLSTCSGYLKAKEVNVVSPTATEDEKKMIEELLKSGVFVD